MGPIYVNNNAVISHKPNGFGYGNEAEIEKRHDKLSIAAVLMLLFAECVRLTLVYVLPFLRNMLGWKFYQVASLSLLSSSSLLLLNAGIGYLPHA